jgi:hypothetical protein
MTGKSKAVQLAVEREGTDRQKAVWKRGKSRQILTIKSVPAFPVEYTAINFGFHVTYIIIGLFQ